MSRPGGEATGSIVIIGGGVYGLGAALAVSKLDPARSVILLERHSVGHHQGSSYGDSRLYRQMHSSTYYSHLAIAALELWRDLEASSGQQLLSLQGLLFFGNAHTGETVEGSLPGALATLREMRLEHQHFADAKDLNRVWPVNAAPGEEGISEAGAGVLHADRVRACLREGALSRGVSICEGEGAERLSTDPDGKVRVVTSRGRTLLADRLIVAAGPWTNDVLSHLGYSFALEYWQAHWGFYRVHAHLAATLPVWYYFGREDPASGDEGLYYGFPADPATHVAKVGLDFAPAARSMRAGSMDHFGWEPDAHMAALLERFMQGRWPGQCSAQGLAVSPYTMTADQDFILDTLPGLPQVVVFAGDCGRGFKFSILLSKVLAELALGMQPCCDIRPLSASRPAAGLHRHVRGIATVDSKL